MRVLFSDEISEQCRLAAGQHRHKHLFGVVAALVLSSALCVSLAACGEPGDENKGNENNNNQLEYKDPSTDASVWEEKTLTELSETSLSGKTVVYQVSATQLNAQGKAFGLMCNLYEDGLVVSTQFTKGTDITITYYGYWETTEDPAIDVVQLGCVITADPNDATYGRFNGQEFGADKNCNTYNQFTISDNKLGGSMNFSVAPMMYGATNSLTVE